MGRRKPRALFTLGLPGRASASASEDIRSEFEQEHECELDFAANASALLIQEQAQTAMGSLPRSF